MSVGECAPCFPSVAETGSVRRMGIREGRMWIVPHYQQAPGRCRVSWTIVRSPTVQSLSASEQALSEVVGGQ